MFRNRIFRSSLLAAASVAVLQLGAGPVLAGSKPYVIGVGDSSTGQKAATVIRMAGQDDPETRGTLCTGEDWVVFSGVSAKNGKIVSVCMSEGDDSTPNHLTYRFGKPGNPEMVWPATAAGSSKRFTLRRYTRPRTTYLKFEFTTKGYNYEILDGGDDESSYTELRVVRVSDGEIVAEHPLTPTTSSLSLMQLEDLVNTAPFDE